MKLTLAPTDPEPPLYPKQAWRNWCKRVRGYTGREATMIWRTLKSQDLRRRDVYEIKMPPAPQHV